MKTKHIILSGGVGSRLWPVSRKSMPKQYIPLFGEKSLFQLTAERNKNLVDETVVVGNQHNYLLSRADLMRAGTSNFAEIIEAAPRNTAAAIAFAAFASHADDILLVTPSDHIITGDAVYADAVREAIGLAQKGYLVTFGIVPTKPETGYGYIESNGLEVISFREKPDQTTAESFLKSDSFLWNSGMFCFRADTYLNELHVFEAEIFHTSKHCYASRNGSFLLPEATSVIPAKSIDYAVMERSKKIKVVQAGFEWSDLGSFESIWDYWESQGENHHFRDSNCVVGSKKHVEFVGVDNIILIETEEAILVLNKSKSQDVKQLYERLEREKPELVN